MIERNSSAGYVVASLMVLAGSSLAADSSKDPTVPPAIWLAAQPVTTGQAVTPSPQAISGGDSSRVQMILVGKQRRFAMIDGNIVKIGDALNDSKVSAIRNDKVVTEKAAKSLGTTPGVEKTAPVPMVGRKKVVTVPEASVSVEDSKGNTGSKQ